MPPTATFNQALRVRIHPNHAVNLLAFTDQNLSAVNKAKFYCERAMTNARDLKLRVEEEICRQALNKYLLLDVASTV